MPTPGFRAVVRSEDCVAGPANEPAFHHVTVAAGDVLVTRMPDGRVVAFSAECPHQATPLEGATFWDGSLRCARHLYLYDVDTGENVLPARESSPDALRRLKPGYLPVHRVEEEDGWIWVAEAPEPAPAAFDPAAERPLPAGARVQAEPAPPAASSSGAAGAPAPAGPSPEHAPETVDVSVGQEFEMVLATSPRPAHMWRSTVSAGVAVVSEQFAPDQPPRHVARLVANATGEAEVRFVYATPWGSEPAETRSFLVRVAPA
jgi:nitrite reductase/ring-hydroxylating ferredoxin subunit